MVARTLPHFPKEGTIMKIAQVAPLYEAVPPRLYGGTERIVAYLSDALVDLGHDVTLFCSADARSKARVIPVRDQAIRLDPTPLKSDLAAHLVQLCEVRSRFSDFDIVHFHIDLMHFPLFEKQAGRTITTLHGRQDLKDLADVYSCFPQYPLVSISDDQRRPLALAHWVETVHHGLPIDLFVPPAAPKGDYLAFIGRISPEKRPDRAISIARQAGMKLRIVAKVDDADIVYFRTQIEPLLSDPCVEFVGEIGDARKAEFLGNARALLFPIDWPEPFGLVMIEAMACGTPVIAWKHGSVPEVLDHGESGFIVDSEEQAVAAVARTAFLDRAGVRAAFERRFTATTMARNYVSVYERLAAAASAGALIAAK